jgi:hypothetical protein
VDQRTLRPRVVLGLRLGPSVDSGIGVEGDLEAPGSFADR